MRIEDERYIACESLCPLVGDDTGLNRSNIGLSVFIDLADVKYIRRGIDINGLPSDDTTTIIFIDSELMEIEVPFEDMFEVLLKYKNNWEKEK